MGYPKDDDQARLRAIGQQDAQAAVTEAETRDQMAWEHQVQESAARIDAMTASANHARALSARTHATARLLEAIAAWLYVALFVAVLIGAWTGIAYIVSLFR